MNSTSSWSYSGQMFATPVTGSNVKGSVVPAGTGSHVWTIYSEDGDVSSRKYTGTWSAQVLIYDSSNFGPITDNSPPSVVVDGRGVVHVVYGNARKTGSTSTPLIEYSHNNTGSTSFTSGANLDVFIPNGG